jgi:hypothetical protein
VQAIAKKVSSYKEDSPTRHRSAFVKKTRKTTGHVIKLAMERAGSIGP